MLLPAFVPLRPPVNAIEDRYYDGWKDAFVRAGKLGWSPEQIAGRVAYERSSVRVCHETIYRFA